MTETDPGHPRRARGPRKLRCDRRRGAAAAPVVDLRVPRFRRQAQVRLQPLGQSDARPARRGAGGSRRRCGRRHHRFGHGRDHAGRVTCCRWARASSRRTTATAARSGCSPPGTSAASSRSTSCDFGDAAAVDAALSKPAALVWIETPSNPLLRITDIADIAQRGHAHGALVVADNTFLSPGWQRPLELGADIVVHSTTKYINGHSDVVGGAVIAKTKELPSSWAGGAIASASRVRAFDSFLTLRGLRTLHVRLREHGRNAQAVAECLAKQPNVKRVYYPGLPTHPGHDIAKRQQSGFGAIVTLEVDGRHRWRATLLRSARALLAGRVARRRREPGRASGDDDARGDGARGARGGGPRRWAAATVDRHRVDRRPAAGSRQRREIAGLKLTGRRACRACSCPPGSGCT